MNNKKEDVKGVKAVCDHGFDLTKNPCRLCSKKIMAEIEKKKKGEKI